MLVAHKSLKFFAAQQSAGDSLPNREIAFLVRAGETLKSLDNGRTTLRASAERLAVGHMLVGMKMLRLADNFLGQMANISHDSSLH